MIGLKQPKPVLLMCHELEEKLLLFRTVDIVQNRPNAITKSRVETYFSKNNTSQIHHTMAMLSIPQCVPFVRVALQICDILFVANTRLRVH